MCRLDWVVWGPPCAIFGPLGPSWTPPEALFFCFLCWRFGLGSKALRWRRTERAAGRAAAQAVPRPRRLDAQPRNNDAAARSTTRQDGDVALCRAQNASPRRTGTTNQRCGQRPAKTATFHPPSRRPKMGLKRRAVPCPRCLAEPPRNKEAAARSRTRQDSDLPSTSVSSLHSPPSLNFLRPPGPRQTFSVCLRRARDSRTSSLTGISRRKTRPRVARIRGEGCVWNHS